MSNTRGKSVSERKSEIVSPSHLQSQKISYSDAQGALYQSKDDVIVKYIKKKNQTFLESKKLYPKVRNIS